MFSAYCDQMSGGREPTKEQREARKAADERCQLRLQQLNELTLLAQGAPPPPAPTLDDAEAAGSPGGAHGTCDIDADQGRAYCGSYGGSYGSYVAAGSYGSAGWLLDRIILSVFYPPGGKLRQHNLPIEELQGIVDMSDGWKEHFLVSGLGGVPLWSLRLCV